MVGEAFVPLELHPDRLLPSEPGVRAIARRLYEAVRELPLISPHGHVDPRLLVDDEPFSDPATLFVTPDHYVTRLLHADGVPLDALGVGQGPLPEERARAVWQLLCGHWDVFRGTSVRYWLEQELAEIFDVAVRPSGRTADAIYDQLAERLGQDAYRPRALFERFRLNVLATTDDPCDDLAGRAALAGEATPAEAVAFRRHMLLEMARMSCDDGLVMTLHPGICRGHHGPTAARYGPDTGSDIPIRVEFTEALRPLLERFGTNPNLHLVLFTVDETVWSRELAPLAGFYPSVYVGVPWWFLDAPEAMRRFRSAVMETAGFSRTSGFVDDTRAFCSIPARHDTARRIDAGVLARLVAEHQLEEDEALQTAVELVTKQPTTVFKL